LHKRGDKCSGVKWGERGFINHLKFLEGSGLVDNLFLLPHRISHSGTLPRFDLCAKFVDNNKISELIVKK